MVPQAEPPFKKTRNSTEFLENSKWTGKKRWKSAPYFGEGLERLLRHIPEKMAAAERRPELSMGGASPGDNLRGH